MPRFIHADNCALYAQDALECAEPWLRWQIRRAGLWLDANSPFTFFPDQEYRHKPRTVQIGEFSVPEPVRSPLKQGQEYWLVDVRSGAAMWKSWCNDEYDRKWLAAGLIHLDKESAQIHIDALLSFTRNKDT